MLEASLLTRRCGACGYRFEDNVQLCPIDHRKLPAADDAAADLGSYRLLERLGEGGMGAVYRAVHRKLERIVAIKILQRDLTSDRGIINRFFHEARAANTIRHENVVEVYDFVEDGENVYFVMELLRGRDLHDTIHQRPAALGPMPPAHAVRVLEQIAAGLHATHARAIVHRDLKPENIFLCHRNGVDDFVKIIDFGVAKLDRPDGLSTVAGAVLGTPEYIAPEQARGLSIDGRADIYSLGCIAYEMLTRHQVFGGGTRTEVLMRQIRSEPPPLRRFAPDLPPALEAAVLRALAKDIDARPETPRAFAENLAAALEQPLSDPGAFHTGERPATVRRRQRTSGLVLRAPAPSRRTGRAVRWALGGVIAALFAGAVLSAQLRRAAPPPPAAAATTRPEAATVVDHAAPPPADPRPAGTVNEAPNGGQTEPTPAPATAAVLLQSVPSGALVASADGAPIGVTPVTWIVPAGAERAVRFQKPGFQPLARQFRASGDTTIAVKLGAAASPRAIARRAHRKSARAAARAAARATTKLDSDRRTIDPFKR